MRRIVVWAAVAGGLALPLAAQTTPAGVLPEIREQGGGSPTLVLLPCFSCRWRSFDTFMDRNADRYRMFAVTLPGHGGTPMPDLPTNSAGTPFHDNAVGAVSRFFDREELDSVIVVGHSFGSDIAVQVAALRPDVVRGLVILDGYPYSDRSWFREDWSGRMAQATQTVADQTERLYDLDTWQAFNTPGIADSARQRQYHGWMMATDQQAVIQYWRENSLKDLNAILETLTIPIVLVRAIPPGGDADRIREQTANAVGQNGFPETTQLVFFYDTRHFIMEERPKALDDLIDTVVRGRTVEDFRPESTGNR